MKRKAWTCLVLAIMAVAAAAEAATPAALQPYEFLLGVWDSGGAGAEGAPSGAATFEAALQGTVMVRRSFAEYPAAGARPAFRHDDLMVIFAGEAAGVEAEYWDNEGHQIRYAVTAPRPGEAVFLSAPREGTPRYRLTYALGEGGVLRGEFAIAPPGKPDEFRTYLSWTARKRSGT